MCRRARGASVTEWDFLRGDGTLGLTLAAMPLASSKTINTIRSARRTGQNLTFTIPHPLPTQKNCVTLSLIKMQAERHFEKGWRFEPYLFDGRRFMGFNAMTSRICDVIRLLLISA
jgi:hypothetical protein